jgi:hypothetical protein
LGTVSDPLAEGIHQSDILDALEQSIEELHQDIMQDDELTDEERWEDELNQP